VGGEEIGRHRMAGLAQKVGNGWAVAPSDAARAPILDNRPIDAIGAKGAQSPSRCGRPAEGVNQ